MSCDCNPHTQEPPRPRALKSPKSLKKVFPGLPTRSVQKVSQKSPNTDFDTFLTLFRVLWDFFDTFWNTPGREAQEDLFEPFWGFRAPRGSTLLYMAVLIAMHVSFLLTLMQGVGWLTMVFICLCLLCTPFAVAHGLYVKYCRSKKPYQFFLCHHKMGSGAFVRLLKMQLQECPQLRRPSKKREREKKKEN